MIDMVLGTDMKQHVTIISRFQTSLQVKLHSRMMTTANSSSSASAESLAVKFEDPADRSMLLQVSSICTSRLFPSAICVWLLGEFTLGTIGLKYVVCCLWYTGSLHEDSSQGCLSVWLAASLPGWLASSF